MVFCDYSEPAGNWYGTGLIRHVATGVSAELELNQNFFERL